MEDKTLQDTPAWSPSRTLTVRSCFTFGALMVLLGSFGALWHMSEGVATLLINSGSSIILGATAAHVGGATAERMAGWFSQRAKA